MSKRISLSLFALLENLHDAVPFEACHKDPVSEYAFEATKTTNNARRLSQVSLNGRSLFTFINLCIYFFSSPATHLAVQNFKSNLGPTGLQFIHHKQAYIHLPVDMAKRLSSSLPTEGRHEVKKPKLEHGTNPTSPLQTAAVANKEPHARLSDRISDDGTAQEEKPVSQEPKERILEDMPPVEQDTKQSDAGSKTKKNTTKRKAGDGFAEWTPPQVANPIPAVKAHWGIVPRLGGYRPSEPQPSARDSNGAVVPALWEDRKGAVRLKRGSRFIEGYDQTEHMWLPLMDMRPISRKNQVPKRKPIGYYYEHGIPIDWNNTAAINDLNKALQEAIKAKSNKEAPFTRIERVALAEILAKTPEASMWDVAEQFNTKVHPAVEEMGQYPTGRFTESICHEYRMYKSTYDKGEAPTDDTEKDIELERLFAAKKAASLKLKLDLKKTKASRKSAAPKTKDTVSITKDALPPALSPYSHAVVAASGYSYEAANSEQEKQASAPKTYTGAPETDVVKSSNHIVVLPSPSDTAKSAEEVEDSPRSVDPIEVVTTTREQTFALAHQAQTTVHGEVEKQVVEEQVISHSISVQGTIRENKIDESYDEDDDEGGLIED